MPRLYKPSGIRQNRPYGEESLQKAVSDVKNGKLSLRKAAEKYGVPASTISEHRRGKHPGKYGGQCVLKAEEEEKLKKALLTCAEWGQPLRSVDIKVIVQGYLNRLGRVEKKFKNNSPGTDWILNFLKRNTDLTVKFCENIKRVRAGVNHETINKYFNELEKTLEGVPPENIINYDETNCSDDPGQVKVVVKRGVKHARRIIDSSKSSISIMMAVTASGLVFPPYTVYKAKYLYDTWVEGGMEGARFNTTPSGWFDQKCFEDWFEKIILPYAKKCSGPKVIIGDNLSSHFSAEVIEQCDRYNIRFVMLPPNSTHLCQPLDLCFFRPLKCAWRNVLEQWKMKNRGVLPKNEFPRLLNETLEKIGAVKQSANAVSGFKAAGISPLNRNAVLKKLPSVPEAEDSTDIEDSWTSSIVEHLNKLCAPEKKAVGRKKRIPVTPGKSITMEQLMGDLLEQEEADQEADLSADDPDPEGISDTSNNAPPSPKIPPVEQSPVKGDFIMVQFTTHEDKKDRVFLGEVLDILDSSDLDDRPKLFVKFLRKKIGKKDTYFVFPIIDDVEEISFQQIIKTVKLSSNRRGMYFFSNFDSSNIE